VNHFVLNIQCWNKSYETEGATGWIIKQMPGQVLHKDMQSCCNDHEKSRPNSNDALAVSSVACEWRNLYPEVTTGRIPHRSQYVTPDPSEAAGSFALLSLTSHPTQTTNLNPVHALIDRRAETVNATGRAAEQRKRLLERNISTWFFAFLPETKVKSDIAA